MSNLNVAKQNLAAEILRLCKIFMDANGVSNLELSVETRMPTAFMRSDVNNNLNGRLSYGKELMCYVHADNSMNIDDDYDYGDEEE